MKRGRPGLDLAGLIINHLKILRLSSAAKNGARRWLCLCLLCNRKKTFIASHLKSGVLQSCGCAKGKLISEHKIKHGHDRVRSRTSEYSTWSQMINRCYNKRCPAYKNYGERGIRVCLRWRRFESFLSDMGPKPSSKHSLDRRDNNKGYNPGNCRWATSLEQMSNTRCNVLLSHAGKTLHLAEWSRRTGVPTHTIQNRIKVLAWPVERALTQPLRARRTA
jgi:hypothetical protein